MLAANRRDDRVRNAHQQIEIIGKEPPHQQRQPQGAACKNALIIQQEAALLRPGRAGQRRVACADEQHQRHRQQLRIRHARLSKGVIHAHRNAHQGQHLQRGQQHLQKQLSRLTQRQAAGRMVIIQDGGQLGLQLFLLLHPAPPCQYMHDPRAAFLHCALPEGHQQQQRHRRTVDDQPQHHQAHHAAKLPLNKRPVGRPQQHGHQHRDQLIRHQPHRQG